MLWPLNCLLPYICFPCGIGIEKTVGISVCKKKLFLSFQNCKWWINIICSSNDLKKLLDSKAKVVFFLPLQCILRQCKTVSASGKTHIMVVACLSVHTFVEADEETASESLEHQSQPFILLRGWCPSDSLFLIYCLLVCRLIIWYCSQWHMGYYDSLPKEGKMFLIIKHLHWFYCKS